MHVKETKVVKETSDFKSISIYDNRQTKIKQGEGGATKTQKELTGTSFYFYFIFACGLDE